MTFLALLYFPTISLQWHFSERKYWHRVFWFYLKHLFEASHSKKKWARYDQKCLLIFKWSTLCSWLINWTWIFSADFPKNFMKIRQLEAESFQEDKHDARTSRFITVFRMHIITRWSLMKFVNDSVCRHFSLSCTPKNNISITGTFSTTWSDILEGHNNFHAAESVILSHWTLQYVTVQLSPDYGNRHS